MNEDIIGKKFNRLTVLKKDEERFKNGDCKYVCQCDCGKIVKLRRYSFISDSTKSCGCFSLEVKRLRNWSGYKKLSKTVFNTILRNSGIRELEFNVTIEQLGDLFEKQGGKCAVTGEEIEFGLNTKDRRTASLDRIDNNKGYTINNIRWVHVRVNQMKNNMSDEELVYWCDKIIKGLTMPEPAFK
jgi:hypothetical protein